MKLTTDIKAGACYNNFQPGWVEKSQGNGWYASVLGADGNRRFVNYAYTEFLNGPLTAGKSVNFTIYPNDNPNAGRVACIATV